MKPTAFRLATVRTLAFAVLLATVVGTAHATTYTWLGTSGNDWTTAANWQGDVAPPSSLTATDLIFGNSGGVYSSINTPYSIDSLTFTSNASAYTFDTGPLTVGAGGFTQDSANTEGFSTAQVILGANQTWTLASEAGALDFGSGVATGGYGLTINAATASGTGNVVSGVISGTGSLTKTGAGTLTVLGNSTYTGTTTVSAGTLSVSSGSLNSTSGLTVNAGTTLAISGTGSISPGINVSPIVDGTRTSAANVTLSGTLSGTGNLSTGTITIGNNGLGTFIQTGGTFTTSNYGFVLGNNAGSSGSYTLGGTGSLSTGTAYIGNGGTGTFTQSGGTFTIADSNLNVGCSAGGSGTYVLSGTGSLSTGDTFVGSNGAGTFTQNGGTFNSGLGLFLGGGGTYMLNAGTLTAGSVAGDEGTGTFHFNGGTLQAGTANANPYAAANFFYGLTTADVQAGGAFINSHGYNVTIAQALTSGTSGTPDGGLTKLGAGTLTLTGANTYTGTNTVLAGTLALQGGTFAGGGTATGGTLQYSGVTLVPGYNTLSAGVGGAILYADGTTITGGYFSGSGTQTVGTGGASFTGTTINNGVPLQVNAATSLTNVTSSGTINVASGETLTWLGGSNYLGNLTVTGTANTSQWTSSGIIIVSNGGTLVNSSSDLILGGGSRTTINSGGTLSTDSSSTIELNGALLTNNGTQTGTLNVNYGSTATGSGTFGNVNVNTGGKFGSSSVAGGSDNSLGVIQLTGTNALQASAAPGTTNVGSLTLHGGSTFTIRVQNATGAAGTGYDLTHANGTLTLASDASATNQIVISLSSLNSSDNPGAAANFDPTQNASFVLVQADAGILGYTSASEFDVDTTGFANALDGGSFSVVENGNDLVLDFNAVPKPSTWAMLAAVGMLLAVSARRRLAA